METTATGWLLSALMVGWWVSVSSKLIDRIVLHCKTNDAFTTDKQWVTLTFANRKL